MNAKLLFSFLILQFSIFAVDFDDLKEKQGKIYGSEKDEKYVYDAFFSEWESWPRKNPTHSSFHFFWIFNSTDYPKYSKSQFLPFYSYQKSKIDKREESNFLLLYNSEIDDKSNESCYFLPLYFSGKTGKNNYIFMPFLLTSFSETYSNQSIDKTNFVGLHYSNSIKNESTGIDETTYVNPFFYWSDSKSKSGNSSTLFFPILPIVYSFEDEKSSRKNFLWLVDYTTENDSLNRFFFMPFVFYKKNEYTTVFPIYFNYITDAGSEKTIIPILYSSELNKDNSSSKNFLLVYNHEYDQEGNLKNVNFINSFYKKDSYYIFFPFYYNWYGKLPDDKKEESSLFLPLFYKNQIQNGNSYLNVLGIFSTEQNEKSETISSNLFPILFYKKDSRFVFFPFYYNWKDKTQENKTEQSNLFFPIYYQNKIQDGNFYANLLGLYSYEENQKSERIGTSIFPLYYYKKDDYRVYFPFVFLFGSESDIAPSGKNFGLLHYHSWDELGEQTFITNYYSSKTKSTNGIFRTFFPFFFYKNDMNEKYLQSLIFYSYQNKNKLDESFYIFPIYFSNEKDVESSTWALNYYTSEDKKKQEIFTTLFPLYFKSEDESSKTRQSLLLFENKNKKTGNYFRTAFPIYYSWKTAKSDGYVFFPFYTNIDYPNKTNFNLNLFGFAKNTNTGIYSPDINLDAGTKDSYTYLDTDFSWLYNVFKIETRISTKLLEEIKEEFQTKKVSKDEKLVVSESPKITKKKDFTRENTLNFFGINFLFSAFSFERGDSKRHFRLLPLTWLTWDNNSKDQLVAVPFYVHFKNQFLEYTVLFPFYGKQKTPEEKRSAYGLFFYLDEEFKKNNHKETSIIWPFFNSYRADNQEGSRLIPFYRHKKTWNESELKENTISLFHYSNSYLDEFGKEKSYLISPFWFSNSDTKDNLTDSFHFTPPLYVKTFEENSKQEFHRFVSLPFYYSSSFDKEKNFRNSIFWTVPIVLLRNREHDEVIWNSFFINNYFDSAKKNNLILSGIYYHNLEYEKENQFLTTRWTLPLFYYYRKLPREGEIYDKLKFYSPLVFYSSFENQINNEKRYDYLIPPLLYYRLNNPKKDYYNFAVLFSYENFKIKEESNLFLTPFFSIQSKPDLSRNYLFPVYLYNDVPKEKRFLSLIYSYQNEKLDLGEETTHNIPIITPFLYYQNSFLDSKSWNLLSLMYRRKKADYISHGFLPFYHNESTENTNYSEDLSFVFPIYYFKSLNSDDLNESNFFSLFFERKNTTSANLKNTTYKFPGIVPIVLYLDNENNQFSWNIFGLAYRREKSEYVSHGFLPFYHNESIKNKTLTEDLNYIFPFYYSYDTKTKDKSETNFASILFSRSVVETPKLKNITYKFPSFVPVLFYQDEQNKNFDWNLLSLIYRREKSEHVSHGFLPFYHNESTNSKTIAEDLNYIFPFYYSYDTKTKDKSETNFASILFSRSVVETPKLKNITYKFPSFVPILFYQDEQNKNFDWNVLSLIYRREKSEYVSHGFLPFYHNESIKNKTLTEDLNYIFPLYYSYDTKTKDKSETNFASILFSRSVVETPKLKNITYKFPSFVPILFYQDEQNKNFDWNVLSLIYRREKPDYISHGFLPFYHNESTNSKTIAEDLNYIFPLYYSYDTKTKDKSETNFASILFSRSVVETPKLKNITYKFPSFVPILFYQDEQNKNFDWNVLSLIYRREKSEYVSHGFLPFYHNESIKNKTLTEDLNYIFPLYYSKFNQTGKNSKSEFYSLIYSSEEKRNLKENSRITYHKVPSIIPFIYYQDSNEAGETNWNLLSVIYSRSSRFFDANGFIPFYHFSTNKNKKNELEESYAYVFPYFQFEDKQSEIKNVMGLLFHQNYSKKEKSNSTSVLYPIVTTKNSKDKFQFQSLFGLIESNSEKDFSDFNFFWLGYKNRSEISSVNLFPFLYSKDTKEEKTKLVLPLLSYSNKSKNEELQSTGLSLIYHSKKDLVTKEEDTFLLGGLLYYKVKRPSERGYEGEGSLWGVLWEYKTESETNYKKLSVLKVITLYKETM